MRQDAAAPEQPLHFPWDLSQTPNYAHAIPVESVTAETLTPYTFYHEYVCKNRPCLISGAVRSWKASRKWRSPDYLHELFASTLVTPRTKPKFEVLGVRTPSKERLAARHVQRDVAEAKAVPFTDVLQRLRTARPEVLWAEALSRHTAFRHLEHDFADFPFRPHPKKSPFFSRWAALFYKNSYSDWHFHKFTDSLLCQIKGTKEVLFFPPDTETWQRFAPVFRNELAYYDIDSKRYPSYQHLRPYRALVRAGDALYLPMNWWHAVQPIDGAFGISVVQWWRAPLRTALDLSYPATLAQIRHGLRKYPAITLSLLPVAAVGMVWAYVAKGLGGVSR